MNENIIKNLRLFNSFLDRILPSKADSNKRQIFDIVEEDKRHIYEVSDKEEIFEGISKVGTDEDSKNSDSFIVMTHPKDDNYKMMLIVDGVGCVVDNKSKKVKTTADYITGNLKRWFSSLRQTTEWILENL